MGGRRVCTVHGCPVLTTEGGRCPTHRRAGRRQRRADPHGFNYDTAAWFAARDATLRRDPICVVCHLAIATVADHHPTPRRDLIADGVPDPDALDRLRGVCAPCHNAHTAATTPGGWHADV